VIPIINYAEHLFAELDGLIEIREIKGSDSKSIFFENIDQLEQYKVPTDKNIFIGMFTRAKRSGKAINCKTTKALWLDFDNTTLEHAQEVIKATGLPEPSYYVNSGHGIHTYWILKQREKDVSDILMGIAQATGADTRATDKYIKENLQEEPEVTE